MGKDNRNIVKYIKFDGSDKLYILKKTYKGWCHKYKLQLIKPIKTKNLKLKKLPTKVSRCPKLIIKRVPITTDSRLKLMSLKSSKKKIIGATTKNKPSNEKACL